MLLRPLRLAVLVPVLLAAACGADAPSWTTEGRRVVPGGAAASDPGVDAAAARRRPRAVSPEVASWETGRGTAASKDGPAPPEPAHRKCHARVRVVGADGGPVASADARLVYGWAAFERGVMTTDADGRAGCDPCLGDPGGRGSSVVRIAAWTADGRVGLSPWRPIAWTDTMDFGDVPVVAPHLLATDEDRAAARVWATPNPWPLADATANPAAADAPAAAVADTETVSITGRLWFRGEPVVWGHEPGAYSRYSGRMCSVRTCDVGADGAVLRCETRRDGTFSLDGLAPGAHDLWVRLERSEWSDESAPADQLVAGVRAPCDDLRIDLPVCARQPLRCFLPDGLPGPPGDCAFVYQPLDGGLDRAVITGRYGRRGSPRLRLRPGGLYSLTLRVECFSGYLAPVRIAEFTPSDAPLDLHVPRGLDVAGIVVRGDGTPVVGARVRVRVPEGTNEWPGHDNADWTTMEGRFRLTGLEPGAAHLEVDAPGLGAAPVVTPGDTSLRIVVARRD